MTTVGRNDYPLLEARFEHAEQTLGLRDVAGERLAMGKAEREVMMSSGGGRALDVESEDGVD